jgi:hypothetical protein
LLYNDQNNAVPVTYTLAAGLIGRTGAALVSYNTLEVVTVNAGSADDSVFVNSTATGVSLTINGHNGDDTFDVGNGDIDLNIVGNVTFSGGLGAGDRLVIDDLGDSGADTYDVSGSVTNKISGGLIIYSTIEDYRLEASNDAGTINVNSSFADAFRVHANGGVDTVNLTSSAPASFVTIDGGAALDTINVNSDNSGTAVAHFEASQDLAVLSILNGGTAVMEPDGNRLLETGSLTVAASALLDLTDNDLILDYTGPSQLALVQAQINLARNFGAWDGFGITSSSAATNPNANTTLGAMEASEYDSVYGAGSLFSGIDPDDTAVLIKYTYYGDTDFNGFVDGDDYARTDSGFNLGLAGWLNGDADGNGFIDGDDYALIDLAFNTQSPVL